MTATPPPHTGDGEPPGGGPSRPAVVSGSTRLVFRQADPAIMAGARPDRAPEAPPAPAAGELPLLAAPAGGVPDVVDEERALVEAARRLGAGTGPLAVDAERASGYRYGQRAYLVQLRREGAGTVLIDPIACPDLQPVAESTRGAEWVLHAATQDLPCLAELGLRPDALFDTELGSRLAGLPRVGLGAVAEHYLGLRLAKEHSAVDWSARPLPQPWLTYAALDVEVLVQLRDAVAADLHAQGKDEWARQEFEALTTFTGPAIRADPWRRTAGMHKVKGRRGAALVRELWQARDRLAAGKDLAPGRVLPDAALVELAACGLRSGPEAVGSSRHKLIRRYAGQWRQAIETAVALPEDELPSATVRSDAPPPARTWPDRNPLAAARLARVRELIGEFAQEHAVPPENVMTPDTLRRIVWDPPQADVAAVRAGLAARGARPWQIDVVAPLLTGTFTEIPGR